jgi:microcompartment protein CcmL/EutN
MNRNDVNPEMREDVELENCIGLLELCSVAKGVEVADAVLKEADVEMLFATNVQDGKYVMLFTGSVRDVESSTARGAQLAGADLVDRLVIQQIDEQVVPMLKRKGGKINGVLDAIGVVETSTVASSIVACDLALKTGDRRPDRLPDRERARREELLRRHRRGERRAQRGRRGSADGAGANQLVRDVVIPSPHADLVKHL